MTLCLPFLTGCCLLSGVSSGEEEEEEGGRGGEVGERGVEGDETTERRTEGKTNHIIEHMQLDVVHYRSEHNVQFKVCTL